MIKLPPNGRWLQQGQSDLFGSLWSSFNLNLTDVIGKTKISPRTRITTDDITDLGVPVAFLTFTDQNAGVQYVWSVAGGYVFRMALASGYQTAFAKDTSAGTPNNVCSSDVSDIAFSGKDWMIVTSTDDIYRYNASTGEWNDGDGILGSGVHMACFYAGKFYVIASAGQKIYSFTPANYSDVSVSGSGTLNITNKGYNVTSLTFVKPASNRIWAGSINQSENGCYMFAWDGAVADDPNEVYIIPDASGVLAGVIKDDTPWIIDSNARLMYFNGSTFVPALYGKLPVKNSKLLKNPLSANNDRWIHPNGMGIVDGRINILVNNEYEDNGATISENFPSGVYEYDPETGWTHKYSLSLYNGSISDYGQNRVSRVGAIYANKSEKVTGGSANGTMLLGAQLFSDSSSTKEVISIDDTGDTLQKYGYLVTTKFFSGKIQDEWEKLYIRFKKFLNSSDTITVKYRTEESAPTEATITWTSTTTFTTTTDVSAYKAGDEVEGIQGKGSGFTAHLTVDPVNNAGTYTCTVDAAFTGASSGTAKVRFQKWRKAGAYNSQSLSFAEFPIGIPSTYIQLKIGFLFTGNDEVDDFLLINKTNKEE